jgi:hypothetical protein
MSRSLAAPRRLHRRPVSRAFRTLQWADAINVVAHLVLIVAALPPVIVHAKAAFAVYIVGVVLLGIGFGGITYAYTSTSSSGVFD